jgi:hypothetical protein
LGIFCISYQFSHGHFTQKQYKIVQFYVPNSYKRLLPPPS